MAEYIEREKDKYIKLSQALEVLDSCACWWAHERMECIPAADVRPVTTCEECVWHVDDGCHNCTKLGMLCPDDADFYCKYGRRPNRRADMREKS